MPSGHIISKSKQQSKISILLGLMLVFVLAFNAVNTWALTDLTIFGPKRYDRLKGRPTVYTDVFDRCNPSDQAILKVRNGDSKRTRIKSARIYVNGTKVASEKDFRQKVSSFDKIISVKEHNELKAVLKSGQHDYYEKLEEFQSKKAGLQNDLARLQDLRQELSAVSSGASAEKIEKLLRELRDIKDSHDRREAQLTGIRKSLDDDADGDGDSAPDSGAEIASGWVSDYKADTEKFREEVRDAIRECTTISDGLDRAPPKKKDKEYEKKKHDLEDLAALLKELDKAINRTLDRLAEIEKKIVEFEKQGPSFLIVEIIGTGCDDTPPVISNPEPADGSLLNTASPRIAANYADNPGGSGIDAGSVRLVLDGNDATSSASISAAGVGYAPPSNLPEGAHAVTVSVSDLAHNPASLTWHFTTDTVPPVATITSPQNNQYLNTPSITVSGSLDDPTATVGVNGHAAQVSGNTFSYAGLALTEGPNAITVRATDPAGNVGTQGIIVNLDTVPPAVAITVPQANAYLNTPQISVSGTVSEVVTSVTVNNAPAIMAGNSYSLSGVALVEGRNTVTVQATDRAGNIGTRSATVTLDTVPPVTTATPGAGLYNQAQNATLAANETATIYYTTDGTQPTAASTVYAGPISIGSTTTLRYFAVDLAGNSETPKSSTYTIDTQPPALTLSALSDGSYTNNAALNISGTVTDNIAVQGVAINGNPVMVNADGTFSQAVTLLSGSNTITTVASDTAGNTTTDTRTVILDQTPPVITVTSPANNSYTNAASVQVAGSLDDATESLTINGAAMPLNGRSFTCTVTLTTGLNSIQVAATDRASNSSSTTVLVTLDQTPPVITVTSPVAGSLVNTPQVAVTGTVNEPVTAVTVNGAAARVSGASFSLANNIVAEGTDTITVNATDLAGNIGSRSVAFTADTQPPVVTLTAPSLAAAGSTITISLNAQDATSGISLAEVTANGASLWSFTPNAELTAQNSISYTLPPDIAPGTVVALQARATDLAGNIGTATAQLTVSQGPSGPGYIQGEVYDDSRGLLLSGATVSFAPLTSNSSPLTSLQTGTDGGYYLSTAQGDYLVSAGGPGFTTVERLLTVKAEQKTVAIDARLTPISRTQNLVDYTGGNISIPLAVVSGATGTALAGATSNIELTIPSNALTTRTDIRVTPVSNQGIANLLPAGWSPIGIADIRALTAEGAEDGVKNFGGQGAALKAPVLTALNLAPLSQVILAKYDAALHQWIAQNPGSVNSDGTAVVASIASTGQYAFVFPDSLSQLAVPGFPLPSVLSASSAVSASDIAASGAVVPSAAPPSQGLQATGELMVAPVSGSNVALTSGIIMNAAVTERFDLLSGDSVVPTDYTQDLILYRYPCITNTGSGIVSIPTGSGTLDLATDENGLTRIGTTFPVTPSREYTIIDLLQGKVSISITLPVPDGGGSLVGTDGGRLLDADGTVIAIPAGALTRTVPVQTKTIAPAVVSGIIGSDFTLLRAINVTITGATLSATAELSIPVPAGFNANLPVVIAKAIDVKGATKLKLVALGRLSGSLITSGLNGLSGLSGILTSGQYFFLQAKAPLGFVTGLVTDASGNPFASALVTTDTCSLADLTGANGAYLVASTVSNFSASALDIYKYDVGTGTGAIAAPGQTAAVNLQVLKVPPRVLSISPADGTQNVLPGASVVVTFSKPLDKSTITPANILVSDPMGSAVQGAYSVNPDGTVATFYPAALLTSQTAYTVTVLTGIKDLQGYQLGQNVNATFTIKNTTPPPMPPAGSITASFPDANGYVTVTGTQGSSPADCTVLIINDTTGEIVSVTPASDGSFTGKISAQLGDEIKIMLMDSSGNQTLVTYIAMKSSDGKYLVTAKGGTVTDDASGAKLDIPEGALLSPTVVKITPVTEAQLPADNPVPQPGKFLSAENIDTGGVKFQKDVHLSIPVPSGFDTNIPVFVTQPQVLQNADGTTENVYAVIDSTKVVNGRIVDGLDGFGIFAFTEFPTITAAIVDGYTFRDMDGDGLYMPKQDSQGNYLTGSDLPVKNAVIRSPGGWNYVTYSNDNGFYSTFTEVTNDAVSQGCKDYTVTAIHPQTMNRVTLTASVCAPPYNIDRLNFKLADANSVPKDTAAPVISLNMQVVAGQTIPGTSIAPQFIAGTIPVGTDIDVPISILDQAIGTVLVTVAYKTPDMTSGISYSLQPIQTGSSLYSAMSVTNPAAIYQYTYTADFTSTTPSTGYGLPLSGSSAARFMPSAAGTYTITVDATDASGNESTRSMSVRAVQFGDQPAGIDGAPHVDEIIPADGAQEIMVTMPVTISFSEAVDPATVNGSTFYLLDETNSRVTASVYTSYENGRVQATLTPRSNLTYGETYQIVITNGIMDYASSNSGGAALGIDNPSTTSFTTKVPQSYDLSAADQFQSTGIEDIAMYTYTNSGPSYGRTFAYVTAGTNGWRVVDVTDPTSPFVVYSFAASGSPTDYRYLAVDQETGILAMTDNTQFTDGNQYGFVRFYDLTGDPTRPARIGQEQLTEAYSGIPGRVALSGNYAYVSTVMAGLQVVDINAAKNFDPNNPGASIVGAFDTVGQGYKQPLDIVVYKGGRAVLTTTSGILLVLDVNQPQYPQLITAYPGQPPLPAGSYTAWHADVAAEYPYIDDAGNSQVLDLAVTSGLDGRIFTVDLTDPYNPKSYGPVKNTDGTDLIVIATDIKISKTSGLVYLSSANGVYVIDIKDPKNPKFLNLITQTPTSPGSATTSPLGSSTALVEKDGWVYLANPQQGMKVLDLDPKELGIQEDTTYGNIPIPSTDYYPALGTKAITIYGVISGVPLDNTWGLYLATQPTGSLQNLQIGGTAGSPAPASAGQLISRFTANAGDKKGYAPLYIYWNGSPDSMQENFILSLQAKKIGATSLDAATSTKIYDFAFRRRHNGNVSLKDVLDGTAVYVEDGVTSQSTGTTTEKQGFDYVQELLNQVVPRMRETYDGQQWVPNQYNLIDEDGIYSAAAYTAVMLFKNSFGIDPNASDTYAKIKKDYGLNATDANNLRWFDKIIERETLVGKIQRIPADSQTITATNADTIPNSEPGNTQRDTGLYELYKNVVERFVNAMIEEGDRYLNSKGTDYQGANTSWISRTGDIVAQSESYCYDCKNKYDDFWTIVTSCTPKTEGSIDNSYARNVNDTGCSLTGSKRYPGLYGTNNEYYAWTGNNSGYPQYNPDYWAGIDCSGFVQRIANYSEFDQGSLWNIKTNIGDIRSSLASAITSSDFFVPSRVSYWVRPASVQEQVKLQKKLKEGDLVLYKGREGHHISMIYSLDKNSCNSASCPYEIIHAYGNDGYKDKNNVQHFTREVLTTPNQFNDGRGKRIMPEPSGFGRIKLWD